MHTQKNGAVSKVDKNLFLTLHGHDIHCQQRELPKFLIRYQQFASHAHCGATGPVSKMSSHQEKAFCVLCFEVSRAGIRVQHEFGAQFKEDIILVCCMFSKPFTKFMLLCNHRSGHLKTEHTESFLLLQRHLGN
jgi:hypothetical protein